MVMMVLLKEACTCAIASSTFLRAFLGFFAAAAGAAPLAWGFCSAMLYAFPGGAFSLTACLRGPLRVRALVRVRWPRTGSPRRWRMPRQAARVIRGLVLIAVFARRAARSARV